MIWKVTPMVLEAALIVGIAARCVLDVVGVIVYRRRLEARTALLAAAAELPDGVHVAEYGGDGSSWTVSVARAVRKKGA